MSDQVFTTLVWLKAVNKMPDLPKDRLVANCYAATLPSEELWARYVSEAERLKTRGDISETDYAVLVHSLEARHRLMELTLGNNDVMLGTVEQVLAQAKEKYIAEVSDELAVVTNRLDAQSSRVQQVAATVGRIVKGVVFYGLLATGIAVLSYGLIYTSPNDLTLSKAFFVEYWGFLLLVGITLLNLIFGVRVKDGCLWIAQRAGEFVEKRIRRIFEIQSI